MVDRILVSDKRFMPFVNWKIVISVMFLNVYPALIVKYVFPHSTMRGMGIVD